MRVLLWFLALVGALLGGALWLLGMATATGAPQEASVSAMALVLAVLPYALARSWDELRRPSGKDRGDAGPTA